MCRILGGNDKVTCMAVAERFEEKYDTSLVTALKKELRGENFGSNDLTSIPFTVRTHVYLPHIQVST